MRRMGIVVVALFALASVPAAAQTAWGPRGGITFDPDQVHIGLHVDTGELFPDGHFVPNVEVGFGDDLTVVALNPELVYRFRQRSSAPWGFYIGGGLGINFVSWDEDDFPSRGDNSDTDLGLNVLGGMSRRLSGGNTLFLELKLGVADSPDAKVTIGLFI